MTEEEHHVTQASAWRDTRRASARLLRHVRDRSWPRLLALIAVTLACFAAWRFLTADLLIEQRLVLLLLIGAVGLWVTEAIPAFAVGLLVMGYLSFALGTDLVLEEAWDVEPYLATWSSEVIWLMLGGYFLAAGMARVGLDRALFARAVAHARGEPGRVLFAVMLTTAVASMVMSNTSTTALVLGAVAPIARRSGGQEPFLKALLVGVPLAATMGGMGTIIGSSPNALAVAMAAQYGYRIDFLDWMLFGAPIALTLTVAAWWFLRRRYPAAADRFELDFGDEEPELPGQRERLVVGAIAATTVLAWLSSPLHGVPVVIVSAIPLVGLTVTRILDAQQVRALPWDTLMLVAGGMSLGAAIVDVGLAAVVVGGLDFLAAQDTAVIVLGVLGLLTMLLSNVMSNTAAVSVLLPVAVGLAPGAELGVAMTVALASSCALALPVSTPPNAIAVSTGLIQARDLRPGGVMIGLAGPALVVCWVLVAVKLF